MKNCKFIFTVILITALSNSFSMETTPLIDAKIKTKKIDPIPETDPLHTKEEILELRKKLETDYSVQEPLYRSAPDVILNNLEAIIQTQRYPFFTEKKFKEDLEKKALDIVIASFPTEEDGPFLINYTKILTFLRWALAMDHNNPKLIFAIINALPSLEFILNHGDSTKEIYHSKKYISENNKTLISEFANTLWYAAMTKVNMFTELNRIYKDMILVTLVMKSGKNVKILDKITSQIIARRNSISQLIQTKLDSLTNKISIEALDLKKEYKTLHDNIKNAIDMINKRIHKINLHNQLGADIN